MMNLRMPGYLASRYRSKSQRVRVVTEAWGSDNLYCAACKSSSLEKCPDNQEVVDYYCPACNEGFQLKSSSRPIGDRIMDAGYRAMMRAIQADEVPNLYILHYEMPRWVIRDLLLVPRYAFSSSIIERRKPLSADARRAGWVGCNIILAGLPRLATIALVSQGNCAPSATVRRDYERLRRLENMLPAKRGWTLDVLRIVQSLGVQSFTNSDVYARSEELERLHPGNHNIPDKIRQQLQVLRDLGLLVHESAGHWQLVPAASAHLKGGSGLER